jgi:hypothetical protein
MKISIFFLWINSVVLSLVLSISVSANASAKYIKVGHTADTDCPARLNFEKNFIPNPKFKVSPDRALVLSGMPCPSKLQVTMFADSENYYITTLDGQPGSVYTRVVNGRTGQASIIEGQ